MSYSTQQAEMSKETASDLVVWLNMQFGVIFPVPVRMFD
jgi:hypothetical protein